jgi:hypothetical protein
MSLHHRNISNGSYRQMGDEFRPAVLPPLQKTLSTPPNQPIRIQIGNISPTFTRLPPVDEPDWAQHASSSQSQAPISYTEVAVDCAPASAHYNGGHLGGNKVAPTPFIRPVHQQQHPSTIIKPDTLELVETMPNPVGHMVFCVFVS